MKTRKNKEVISTVDNTTVEVTVFARDLVYTIPEVAEMARVSTSHIRRAIQRGELPTVNLGGDGIGADRRILGYLANAWLASRLVTQPGAK